MKNYKISFGMDIATIGLIIGVFMLHMFILSMHPLFKFISRVSPNQMLLDPNLIPSKSFLVLGVITIIGLLIISLLLILYIFTFSRSLMYKYLMKEKIKYSKTLKVFLVVLLFLIPLLLVHLVFAVVIQLIFVGISNLINYNIAEMFSLFITYFTLLLLMFIIYLFNFEIKQKYLFRNLDKIPKQIKKNKLKFLLAPLYGTGIYLLVYLIFRFVIFRSQGMLSLLNNTYIGAILNLVVVLVIITYIRIQAIKCL